MDYDRFSNLYPNPNGYGYVIRGGVKIAPTFIGSIKKNMVVCDVAGTPTGLDFVSGGYIKLDQSYDGIAEFDNTRILTNADGTAKVLAYDTLVNAPATNPQLFVSTDKQQLMFFQEPLTDGSECFNKANSYLGLGSTDVLDGAGVTVLDGAGDSIQTGG